MKNAETEVKIVVDEAIANYNEKNPNNKTSRKDLAEATGVSYQTVSDWSRGKSKPKAVTNLYRISKALGCSISDLVKEV